MPAHDPVWPDKIMAAALLVVMGGILGAAFVVLRWSGATVHLDAAPLLEDWPNGLILTACASAVVLGVFGYIHQSWLLTSLGILADVVSLGFLGISSLIGLVAVWPLVRSFAEGEETRLDRRRMHAHQWPDKAILASTLLTVGAVVALVHGILLVTDRVAAPEELPDRLWGAVSLLAGVVAAVAARQVFHMRHVWIAWTAVALLALCAAFYFAGPGIALVVALYLWLAQREGEFLGTLAPGADST